MNNNAGYQPPAETTVVVMSTTRPTRPNFLQHGVQIGGLTLGAFCVTCLAMFGGFFLLSGTIMLATANNDDDFWDKFDRDTNPIVVVGSIFLVIGIILVVACVTLACFSYRKYKKFQATGNVNPGRVINPPPSSYHDQPQTAGYPGQPQPAAYPGQPQPAGFGQPQPYGYPYQPQPAGYPSQPSNYPAPNSSYPGPPGPYPQPPGEYATQPQPPYPEKTTVTNVTSEYAPPPPTAPDSSVPPPYQP